MEHSVAARVNELEKKHHDLKQEVAMLERRAYLTPDERRYVTDLKKLKLQTKDALFALRRQL